MLSEVLDGIALAEVPGCCVGLLSGDSQPEFVYSGRVEREGDPVSGETLWETASLSKPVVALLALERGTLDPGFLTQPLIVSPRQLGAAVDDRWGELTLWHTLTHTTGLPNWRSTGESLSFESDPGSPGYSGEGFELLLAELSKRLGSPASSLLKCHLNRLQMAASSFTPDFTSLSKVAIGHLLSGEPIPKRRDRIAMASGSLHATAADYMRFLSVIARPDRAADSGIAVAAHRMASRSVETLPGHGRTLGWAFTQTASGDVLWQHGDNPGFKHVAAVCPDTERAVFVFTNGDAGQTIYREVCRRVMQVDVW